MARSRGRIPRYPLLSTWEKVWRPFWALPLAICLGALVLGFAVPEIERVTAVDVPYAFRGGPESARSLLSTIASAMISVTGLVFSVTLVVLQLASSQFTPRILRSFLRSRITQVTLGVFIASFVFALMVLRVVRDEPQFVPQGAVTMAFLVVLVCVGLFIAFIHHITTSIQVTQVMRGIGAATRRILEHERADEPVGPTWSPRPGMHRASLHVPRSHGYLDAIDYRRLMGMARDAEAVIVIDHPLGTFLTQGQALGSIYSNEPIEDWLVERAEGALPLSADRSKTQDASFGVRQLTDIADRALSPGVNDPTTAVQVLDELHPALRTAAQTPDPGGYFSCDGEVVLVQPSPGLSNLLEVGVVEIWSYGSDAAQIRDRIHALVTDLREVALDEHRAAIDAVTAAVGLGSEPRDGAEPATSARSRE